MQLKEGSTLQGGKYRIIRVLGQGGFGITYLAENTFFEKKVAIKEFFPKEYCGRDATSHITLGTQNNEETVTKLRERFIKEARNIAKLDYPGIVKIHDIFEENNTAYYVMDYIEGESLNDMVKRYGPLPEGNAIEYIRKVGQALEYIHSRKMTHFDVKPANIVVRKSDNLPILIDFGLSKQYDSQGDATSTMMQALSHGYAPMEMYSHQGIMSFSPQTDVYSLAATLLYLLTAQLPPQASIVIEEGLSIPALLDDATANAILTGMDPSRKKRFATVKDFLGALPDIKPVPLEDLERTRIIFPDDEKSQACEKMRLQIKELKEKHDAELSQKQDEIKRLKAEASFMESRIGSLTEEAEKKPSKKWRTCSIFMAIVAVICIIGWINEDNYADILRDRLIISGDEINTLEGSLARHDKLIENISKGSKVFIWDIDVRNDGQDYGEKIYSTQTTFINPRFDAINLSDNPVEIGIKFYTPGGMSTGTPSQRGYSYVDTIPAGFGYTDFLNHWMTPLGWGGEKKGHWSPGNYRFEFWVEGKCVATKKFTIY